MRICTAALTAAAAVLVSVSLGASGPVGIYGIVDKVVFEPDEARPERVQVWGAFAFVDQAAASIRTSQPARGHLYFRLPTSAEDARLARREWMDLKALAGTGQAIGFGTWQFVGTVDPSRDAAAPGMVLRVGRPSEPLGTPIIYAVGNGIVKLNAQGAHAGLVGQLRDAMKP